MAGIAIRAPVEANNCNKLYFNWFQALTKQIESVGVVDDEDGDDDDDDDDEEVYTRWYILDDDEEVCTH